LPARARAAGAAVFALTLLAAIAWVFWQQDLQYSRPTPRPAGWHRPAVGTAIALPRAIEDLRAARRGAPVLLHFFNPACPCSRFNIEHVRALAVRFHQDLVVVAVLSEGDPATMRAAYRALPLGLPSYVDADHRLADAVGVYSTPQAAVLDGAGRLFYQGNYNLTRYCVNRNTEFARLALEAVVAGRPAPRVEPVDAATAYGCPLPPRATAASGI
jgi:hypothetical protein